ncbi:phenylacetic acid degradation protein [Salinisphaera dokdonensis CL-ES53]|uniref:Phenylacetic acid degradation protein n=1 Tax=Salinisphaera dokdonensis CL-ES53 TaxID=1304272 RepID=A0ABV2B078_9GAMM
MQSSQNGAPAASVEDDPQALADRVGEAMLARDAASRMLGMQVEAMAPGYARVSMPVRDDMVNGHQTCHGGLIFSLADSAFAFACNSGNQNTVGAACNVDYLRPAFIGDVLTAEAEQRSRSGRTGVYDVTVRNQNDETVVLFRGRSHQVRGEVLEVMAADA